MSDPIEKLTRLGDALEGAPMPLPASEIRARGDRIRRRRHAVVAGAAAAVVAAVAVPVIALTVGDGSSDKVEPAPQPTVTDPVPPAPLSKENLLTEEDAGQAYGGAGTWVASSDYRGDGQDVFSPCTPSALADFGAEPVFRRNFALEPARVPSGWMTAIAGQFPDDAAARSAYDDLSTALRDCDRTPATPKNYTVQSEEAVPVDVTGEAHRILATYDLAPDVNAKAVLETGLVLSGDRIEIVTSMLTAQDYDFGSPPMEAILPAAAERLVIGGGATSGTEGPTADWPTTIPDGVPLTSGWPTDDGSSEYRLDAPSSDNRAMIAAGELQACGNTVVDPGPIDRLTTRLSYGSAAYARELVLLPTDQEAVTYVAHFRAVYGDCPEEGSAPTFTTEVTDGALGDESVVVTRVGDEIYRTVVNVVRFGNAVVVDLASDEGNAADIDALVTETRENLADVAAAMADLQGADPSGPGTNPDPADPAGTTTIPDGFPLDLALGEPPVADGETTVEGPGPDVSGANPETACGLALSFPNAGSPDPAHELGYSVSTIEGYDGRTIRAYPTAQEAVDQMAQLRSQLQGCDRDGGGDGLSARVWRTFASDTGYDSETFGWYYEATEFQGATAGALYTVVRVGNAVVAINWGGEYSADYQADAAPNQVELARLIAAEMCVFAAAGC